MWANTSIPAMRCLPSLKDMLARSVVILLMLVLIGQCIHVSAQEPREAALVVKGPPNDEVKAMAISGDRRLVASANWDHTIKVWEAATGRVRVTFQGHSKVARCLAFSPDGKRIASCTFPTLRSDELKIWDTGTGREVLSLGDPARTVCFSFDGKRLASVLDATIHLWDATSGRKLLTLTGHTKQVRSLAFTPDGKSLASSADDESVRVWDLPAGQEKRAFRGQPSEYANSDLAFGPDSKQLALATSSQGEWKVKTWDATTGQEGFDLGGSGVADFSVVTAVFSPVGTQLAVLIGSEVRILDTTTGMETLKLVAPAKEISLSKMAFTSDGKQLTGVGLDNVLSVWRLAD